MSRFALSLSNMAKRAGEVAALMRALSSENRLLILCHLIQAGELPVGALVERVGLSQSALSQHLARLREEGLVSFRRDAQTLFYRVADPRAGQVIQLLHDIFCAEIGAPGTSGQSPMAPAAAGPEYSRKGE